MAESLCGGSLDEKDPEKEGSERVARSWRKMVGAGGGKGVPETEMAETLGCYDGQCGKEERREHSGELQHLTAFVLRRQIRLLCVITFIFLIFININ